MVIDDVKNNILYKIEIYQTVKTFAWIDFKNKSDALLLCAASFASRPAWDARGERLPAAARFSACGSTAEWEAVKGSSTEKSPHVDAVNTSIVTILDFSFSLLNWGI